MTEFVFTPATVNVAQGDTVIWTNNGAFRHSSTSGLNGIPDGIWDSGLLNPGGIFSQPFPNVGSFPYFCTVHSLSMTGVVVVAPSTGFEEDRQVVVPSSLALSVSPNPFLREHPVPAPRHETGQPRNPRPQRPRGQDPRAGTHLRVVGRQE
jgi:hypothetical protein